MGKHAKPKTNGGGRHAKPTVTSKTVKRAAAIGGTAVAVPTAALAFSAPNASAATAAAWDKVAVCESSSQWHIDYGDGGASIYGGGLQFQPASWHAAIDYLHSKGIDTSHFGQWAYNSTKQQQILAAEALLAVQPGHPDPWACDPGQELGPSMFDGGANPWGLPGAQIPASVIDGSSGDDFNGGGAPAPVPTPTPTDPAPAHHWKNCTEAHRHGWHDFRRHSSGYRHALDGDGDGIACETGGWHHTPPPVTPPPAPTPTDPAPGRAPAECDHIVVKGDTVSAVARDAGAPLADVEAVNPGIVKPPRPGDFSLIYAGGHIHMPAGFCATGE